jgi:hypothetical protein
MGDWNVTGARKSDAQTVMLSISAATEDEARRTANEQGVLVESAVQATSPPPQTLVESTRAPRVEYATPQLAGKRYHGLTIVALTLSVLAWLFYPWAVLALCQGIAIMSRYGVGSGGNMLEDLLSIFRRVCLEPLMITAAGATLHAISVACLALRDIARSVARPS